MVVAHLLVGLATGWIAAALGWSTGAGLPIIFASYVLASFLGTLFSAWVGSEHRGPREHLRGHSMKKPRHRAIL